MEDLELYDLERHLFGTVRERFLREGSLGAFDLMCIIAWKANRAKPQVAKRLLTAKGHASLEEAARAFTSELWAATEREEKLRTAVEGWGFLLPMATAILTVLYPEDFTVCDVRVADQIGKKVPEPYADFSKTWATYHEFVNAVVISAPAGLSLLDKNRFLWAKSFREQLQRDIAAWERMGIAAGVQGLPLSDDLRQRVRKLDGEIDNLLRRWRKEGEEWKQERILEIVSTVTASIGTRAVNKKGELRPGQETLDKLLRQLDSTTLDNPFPPDDSEPTTWEVLGSLARIYLEDWGCSLREGDVATADSLLALAERAVHEAGRWMEKKGRRGTFEVADGKVLSIPRIRAEAAKKRHSQAHELRDETIAFIDSKREEWAARKEQNLTVGAIAQKVKEHLEEYLSSPHGENKEPRRTTMPKDRTIYDWINQIHEMNPIPNFKSQLRSTAKT